MECRELWEEEAAAQNPGRNAENGEPADGDPCGHKVKFSLMHIKFVQFFLKLENNWPQIKMDKKNHSKRFQNERHTIVLSLTNRI